MVDVVGVHGRGGRRPRTYAVPLLWPPCQPLSPMEALPLQDGPSLTRVVVPWLFAPPGLAVVVAAERRGADGGGGGASGGSSLGGGRVRWRRPFPALSLHPRDSPHVNEHEPLVDREPPYHALFPPSHTPLA